MGGFEREAAVRPQREQEAAAARRREQEAAERRQREQEVARRRKAEGEVSTAELNAFLKKVGSSIDMVRGATKLDWSFKLLTGADCKVIAHLAASGAMPNLETLEYAQPLTALSTSARPFVHCQ